MSVMRGTQTCVSYMYVTNAFCLGTFIHELIGSDLSRSWSNCAMPALDVAIDNNSGLEISYKYLVWLYIERLKTIVDKQRSDEVL